MGNWKIITPLATTNLLTNPTFELGTDTWGQGGSNTIAQSIVQQKFGRYSMLCTYINHEDLLTQSLSLPNTNATYFLTSWIYVPANYDGTVIRMEVADFSGAFVTYPSVFTVGTDPADTWFRLVTQIDIVGDVVGRFVVQEQGTPTSSRSVFFDGVQLEEQETEETTYCDGDQPGCVWNGDEHASTSSRPATTRLGGAIKDLETEYNFIVERMAGVGATPMRTMSTGRAILPGREWQKSVAGARTFTLVGTIIGSSMEDFHSKRQGLVSAVAPDGVAMSDPVNIRYTGAAVDKQITARYIGGLDLSGPSGFSERIAIQFMAHDPFFSQIGNQADSLTLTTAIFRNVAAKINGKWNNLGEPHASGTYNDIRAIAKDPTSENIYLAGSFSNFDNIPDADTIVRYTPSTNLFSAVGPGIDTSGGNAEVMTFSPDGTLYIAGNISFDGIPDIVSWDGTSYSALGTPTGGGGIISNILGLFWGFDDKLLVAGDFTGLDGDVENRMFSIFDPADSSWTNHGQVTVGSCQDVLMTRHGVIYICGNFTTVNGVSAKKIARWNPKLLVWEPLAGGINGSVINTMAWDEWRQILYIGGIFTTTGDGMDANNVARWNGSRWGPLGSGTGGAGADTVYSIAVNRYNGNLVVGGLFDEAGGIVLSDSIAEFNGSSWLPLDIEFPGDVNVRKLYFADKFGVRRPQLWTGISTEGIGTYPNTTTTTTNNGTAKAFPIVKITRAGGTSSNIHKLTNVTTDVSIYFDYAIMNGETLTIDFRPGKLTMTSSYNDEVIFRRWEINPASILGDFFLLPGDNEITLYHRSLGSPTITATIEWSDQYWSID